MIDTYRAARAVAERAAVEAGALLKSSFGRVSAREKGPGDLVTDADLTSQRAIAAILLDAFPDHTILGEEEGLAPDPANPWRWVVDPLDGTVNFAHGVPLWCVSIALEHLGELVVGVVHQPILGTTHSASAGGGATLDGRPIRVSSADSLSRSLIACGMPTDFAADAPRQLAYFGRMSTGTHSVRRTGTSAWNLAMVASGGFDLCYGTSLHPWDAAAGVALIREAGGAVAALDGSAFDLYSMGIVAGNPALVAEAVAALRSARPG